MVNSAGNSAGDPAPNPHQDSIFMVNGGLMAKPRVPSLLNRPLTTHPAKSTGVAEATFRSGRATRPRLNPVARMSISDTQERHRVLAENAATMPKDRARDLAPPDFERRAAASSLGLDYTDSPSYCSRRRGRLQPARERAPPRGVPTRQRRQPRRRGAQLAGNQMHHNAVTSRALHDTVEIDQPARALPRCRGNYRCIMRLRRAR
jgi:hypothetical protein